MGKKSPCFVLIIDDEVSILEMLEMQLNRKGMKVDTAENGKQALKKIDNHDYDVILTDMKMPDTSGDQILRYIKSEKDNSLPVVGMSGTPWLLEDQGFDAVLTKPCFLNEILDTLEPFCPNHA